MKLKTILASAILMSTACISHAGQIQQCKTTLEGGYIFTSAAANLSYANISCMYKNMQNGRLTLYFARPRNNAYKFSTVSGKWDTNSGIALCDPKMIGVPRPDLCRFREVPKNEL